MHCYLNVIQVAFIVIAACSVLQQAHFALPSCPKPPSRSAAKQDAPHRSIHTPTLIISYSQPFCVHYCWPLGAPILFSSILLLFPLFQKPTMQLCNNLKSSSCSLQHHRAAPRSHQQLTVRAQAPLSGSTGGASSNSTGTSNVAPLTFDRPAGGGSRSFDLPRSSDSSLVFWAPRSDVLRPSGGAARNTVFASSGGEGSTGSIDRPGGRGGRSDMPSGWDSAPQTNPTDPAYGRPGGRGGRDSSLSSMDQPAALSSIDRPGGRGGREGPTGGDGGSSGGSGGSGGSSGGDSGSSGSSEEGGFSFAKAAGSAVVYAIVIAAAWAGYQNFIAPKEDEPVKPCCAGKGKKK